MTSISFLVLLILMTLPLYSIVFLFGGVVPSQVLAVFGLQFITLGAIASVSIFWSTFVQRTGWSTVLSYATVATVFIGCSVVGYLFDTVAAHSPDQTIWVDLGTAAYTINPIYMQASLETSLGFITPSFHNSIAASVFNTVQVHNLMSTPSWLIYATVYVGGSFVLLFLSAWHLRPGTFAAVRKRIVRWFLR